MNKIEYFVSVVSKDDEWLAQERSERREYAGGEALCDEARIGAVFAGRRAGLGRSVGEGWVDEVPPREYHKITLN